MDAPNRNTAWARILVDELARCGVGHVALAPGSRSTPLVLAAHRDDRLQVHTHLDERSAAFFALGIAKATGTPAGVITTSGTAAANLHPAAIETIQSRTPLLLLTADRPHRLRATDANQTIDQVKLYGDDVVAFHDVSPPILDGPNLRALRQVACRAVGQSLGPPAGPVHLNLPFDKPLEPTEVPGDVPEDLADQDPLAVQGRPDGSPFLRPGRVHPRPAPDEIDDLVQLIADHPKGLIVAGPHPEPARLGPAVIDLARATGYPVLADPLSGARFGPGATGHSLAAYDLYLRDPEVAMDLDPGLVIRVGTGPTSKAAARYLARHDGTRQILIDAGPRSADHLAVATDHLAADAPSTLATLSQACQPAVDKAWLDAWQGLEILTREVLEDHLGTGVTEGAVLAQAAASLTDHQRLVVSNSMPVRDLDTFAAPRETEIGVLANRGASGIDGVLSTALGAATDGTPTLAVLGDLAFLHDLGGLHVADGEDLPVTFLVIDNDGGGIFHMLPIREHEPPFTEHFATPHGLDLAKAADLFDLPYTRLETRGDLADALAGDPGGQGVEIVHVTTDRDENEAWHDQVDDAVRRSIQGTRSNGGKA